MPLLDGDGDPLGVEGFASHHIPLAEAPEAYKTFQNKDDGAFRSSSSPEWTRLLGSPRSERLVSEGG
jgi:hypothetical protein